MEDVDEWISRQLPPREKRRNSQSTEAVRQTKPLDGRARIVRLTDRGRKFWEEVKPKFEEKLNETIRKLSAQEIDKLAEGILRLREELKCGLGEH